jgi:hypothetical protein
VDAGTPERLRRIWNQKDIPVLLRRGPGHRVRMRLPYEPANRRWIRRDRRTNPEWDEQRRFWEVPQAWFNALVGQCLEKFGRVYIIQPYREQEKCAPACWNAVGDECQCSCMGDHHGMHSPAGQWKVVSDTFATSWGEQALACRLVERKTVT